MAGDVAGGGIIEIGNSDELVEIGIGLELDCLGKCFDFHDRRVCGSVMLRHGFFVSRCKYCAFSPWGACFDPLDEKIDFVLGQWLAFSIRRHDVIIIMGQLDPQNDFRFLRILQKKSWSSISAFEHRLARTHIEIALFFVRIMAAQALFLKQLLR